MAFAARRTFAERKTSGYLLATQSLTRRNLANLEVRGLHAVTADSTLRATNVENSLDMKPTFRIN